MKFLLCNPLAERGTSIFRDGEIFGSGWERDGMGVRTARIWSELSAVT